MCGMCGVIGETDVQELSFATQPDHAPNPHLEEILAMQTEVEKGGGGGEGEEGRGEVTLLHLMDEDDDD